MIDMNYARFLITVFLTVLALLASGTLHSEVIYTSTSRSSFVDVRNEAWQPEGFVNGTIVPATYIPVADLTMDGMDNEPEWSLAIEVPVLLNFGSVSEASLKALYTDDEVFIRVRWRDETENREHHPWIWDAGQGRYLPGPQIEDSVLLSFEAGCEWSPSFLAGYVYDYDAWQWMAARTDPLGQAVDLYGTVQSQDHPVQNFVKYQSRSTENAWNVKFETPLESPLYANWSELDRSYFIEPTLDTVYVRKDPDGGRGANVPDFVRQLPAPEMAPQDDEDIYPQFLPLRLEGQAGEVDAKGHWEDGYWTVEFRRVRITPADTLNDTVFTRLTQFAVHVYDQVERLDQASESGRLFLRFMEEEQLGEDVLIARD
jgi:hypothetical protein